MSVTVGESGVDLDSDGRLDVTTIGVDSFSLATADGSGSTMNGAGSDATGGSFAGHLEELGGSGDDVLIGGSQFDVIVGGQGGDSIDGGAGRDFVVGGAGDDSLSGGAGADTIHGGKGNDLIEGGPGRDHCDGGAGDDAVHCEVVAEGKGQPYSGDAAAPTLFAAFVRRDLRRAAVRLWTMPFDAALSRARAVSSA